VATDAEKFDLNYPGPDNLFGYTGLGYDASSGLSYARARYFDSSIGRFISQDTYEGELNNPLSLNLYTYVHNNPLIYVDPTGNYCVSQDGKWARPGNCSSSDSIYLGEDSEFVGRPIINNGTVGGYIGVNGPYSERFTYSGNYWSMYSDDYSYIRWIAGDNDYFFSLSQEKQDELKTRLFQNYMEDQIRSGFPDFRDGVFWGVTLATLGRVKVTTGVVAKGTSNVVSREIIIKSAIQGKKGGETVVGHALQKHAGRNPHIWGKIKGGPDQINQTALKHLEEIIDATGDFIKVKNGKGITFLEKKLPDGRGVRLNLDGTFKGFIDQ